MNTARRALIVGLAALSAAGCKPPSAAPGVADREVPPIQLAPEDYVTVARATLQTGPRLSGTLQASRRAVVRAEVGGVVVAIGPEIGQLIKAGDLLARVEVKALGDVTASARSGVTSAQAQADLARREVERISALVEGGALARRELDRARSQLTAAEAGVTQARAQLSSTSTQLGDATVRAPIAGVVARRMVSAGDVVTPGGELYEVIDPTTMRLDAAVAADDLSALAIGKPVDFEVRGYPGDKFTGAIARIAPVADPVTRQLQVLVDIPSDDRRLVAGLYAVGRVAVDRKEALVVPFTAIDGSGDQPTVLRVGGAAAAGAAAAVAAAGEASGPGAGSAAGKAAGPGAAAGPPPGSGSGRGRVVERVAVALGVRDERSELVEVTSGLAAGDVVVLARAGRSIVPGAKVEVISGDKPAAPSAAKPAELTSGDKPAAPSAAPPAGAPAAKAAPPAGGGGGGGGAAAAGSGSARSAESR